MTESLELPSNIDSDLEGLLEVATTQKQLAVDNWIDAIKDDDQYDRFINLHLDGTCHWILNHSAYVSWISREAKDYAAKLLWIHGAAGFGKTVLCAWIIRHLSQDEVFTIARCFSSSHAQRIDQMDGIVRTWVTQLVRKEKSLVDLAHQILLKQNTRRASGDEIWDLLKEIITRMQPCVLILDGLDEFQKADDRRVNFLNDLKMAVQGTSCHILITSRDEYDIESGLRCQAAELPDYKLLDCVVSKSAVKHDIEVVSQAIVARKLPRQDKILRDSLAFEMAQRCDGQFLWLKMQQDLLRDSKSAKALRAIVQAMPQKLHSIYERSWDRIEALEDPDRSRAMDTLRWVTFAYRPLLVQELAEALVVNLESDMVAFSDDDLPSTVDDEFIDGEIKNLCGPFVELQDDSQRPDPSFRTVHLVHASVYEFLVKKLPVPPLFGSGPDRPRSSALQDADLAARCIRFLDSPQAWESRTEGDIRSFARYATHAWFSHLRDSAGYYENVSELVNDFLRSDNSHFNNWKRRYEGDQFPYTEVGFGTPFYYACLFGFVPVMEFLHNTNNCDLNFVGGGYYGTPLQAVCATGCMDAFKCLMSWKADPRIRSGRHQTALNAAAYFGHLEIVKALLDQEVPGKHEAIIIAAGRGHTNIVRLLLDKGAHVNGLNLSDPLHPRFWANMSSAAPLLAAADNGHAGIVKLLLKDGADVSIRTNKGDTALHLATIRNDGDIIKLLLEKCASANAENEDRNTALHLAVDRNSPENVTLLLEHGADIDILGSKGTPLQMTALFGFPSMAKHLIDHKALLDARGKCNTTALHYAAGKGHLEVADLILDRGADVNAESDCATTPLHMAMNNSHIDIAKSLLKHGAAVNADSKGWTPLHIAMERGWFDIVPRLIECGGDVNARTELGWTPLHSAIHEDPSVDEQQLLKGLQLLLARGATYSSHNHGWTPLHLAAKHGYFQIIALFLDQGRDVNAKTYDGHSPLHIAVESGKLGIVKLLLSRGADVNSCNDGNITPLHVATTKHTPDFMQSLLEKDCNLNVFSLRGDSPLHNAIFYGTDEMVECLIHSGANLGALDRYGMGCSAWLTRLRPNFLVPQSASQNSSDLSAGPSMPLLRSTALKETAKIREDVASGDFYTLAHCFLLLDMEEDAKLAYALLVRNCTDVPYCDLCHAVQNVTDTFFACKICPGTDLCEKCMEEYDRKGVRPNCHNHEFLKIIGSEANFRPDETEAFDQWLGRIIHDFKNT